MPDQDPSFLSSKNLRVSIKDNCHFIPFLGAGVSSLEPSKFVKGKGDQIEWVKCALEKKCMGELRRCPGAVVKFRVSQLLASCHDDTDETHFIKSFFKKKYGSDHICTIEESDYIIFNESQKETKIQQLNTLLLETLRLIALHIKGEIHSNEVYVDPLYSYCEVPWTEELSGSLEINFSNLFEHLLTMCKPSYFCDNQQDSKCNITDCKTLIEENLLLDEIEKNMLGMAIIFIKPYSKFKEFIVRQDVKWQMQFRTFMERGDAWHPFLEKIKEDDRQSFLEKNKKKQRSFFFGHYEWLGDLLWHTLRFDDCKIPTAHELSFRIALSHTAGLMMPGELAQSAELAGLRNSNNSEKKENCQSLQALIKPWLDMCEENSLSPYNAVHAAIASLLEFQQSCLKKDTPSKKNQICFAMTTNYDNCLERSIVTGSNNRCTVLFPISIISKDRNSEEIPQLRWCLYTVKWDEGNNNLDYREFRFLPYDENPDLSEALGNLAEPYVVVKLHGAPLYEINDNDLKDEIENEKKREPPRLNSWTSDEYGFQHAVILSESGYLAYLQNADAKYSFVIDEIVKGNVFKTGGFDIDIKRRLWFFGYSLKDWNIRLSLYNYVTAADGGTLNKNTPANTENEEELKKYALFKTIDPYQTAILKMLRVNYAEENLEEVGKMLFRAANQGNE